MFNSNIRNLTIHFIINYTGAMAWNEVVVLFVQIHTSKSNTE